MVVVVVVVVMVTHSDGVRALQGGVPPQKIQLRRQQGFPVYYMEAEQTELSRDHALDQDTQCYQHHDPVPPRESWTQAASV